MRDGLEWYRPFIVTGLRMLVAAAEELGCYPAFRGFSETCLELATARLGEDDAGVADGASEG
jgi:hypothetical protein